MVKANQPVSFRFTPKEVAVLKAYSEQEGRTQTDVVRELVRSLEVKLNSSLSQNK